ncbi:alpha/beta-hydrolase [Hypoxylon cercidicola]|nr:alpha/beta-hydrolase [Hypoxylon cercidicola]
MLSKTLLVLAGLLWQSGSSQSISAPVVDLGYARYQGYYNETYGLNIYKGIRYAAPPVGKLRWQRPHPPAHNRSQVIPAIEYGSQCPQTRDATPGPFVPAPSGSEDCLFLNVVAPASKKGLPVLFWIHGGGYGLNSGSFDPSSMMRTNENSYITVTINYRLGAFGFLSSAEVAKSGVVNAGIHDMQFALQWVQEHIHLFGGDPRQVTIAGESAGGGAVMLLGIAYGGALNTALFNGIIAASPYLPTQWDYDDTRPTEYYYQFADTLGCLTEEKTAEDSVFECLVSADTVDLQNASSIVTMSGLYGQWAFVPVTDGIIIQDRPSNQLLKGGKLNGIRILTSNNANEGPDFTPQGITSEHTFRHFLLNNYPRLGEENVTNILALYSVPPTASEVLANSDGENPPYSTTNSEWASGWQQAATNLYAEATFVCPSYWLADGFASKKGGKAWRYQFSVPPAQHSLDLDPLLEPADTNGPGMEGMDEVFRTAFQQIWGNFVVNGDPELTLAQTNAVDNGNITAAGSGSWPQWSGLPGQNWMLNLNMTGGAPSNKSFNLDGVTVNVTIYGPSEDASSSPLEAVFKISEGTSWEGGRGERCQLWAELGPWILE